MNKTGDCRVLLCGTQYGQVYLPAIFESRDLELVAILARGSDRSIRISEQCGVNLFTEVKQVDQAVNLACVAIGGSAGCDIATALLEKGIPVLLEHPVSIENIQKILNTAKNYGTFCHINSHFSEVYPIAQFIALCQKLNTKSTPNIISICCNTRTLFSTLDILLRCFGEFSLDEISSRAIGSPGLYLNGTFLLNEIPCTIIYQKWRGKHDDSKDSPLGHQITVTYPEGVLCLNGTFGPCLWMPLAAGGVSQSAPLYSDFTNDKMITLSDMYHWRMKANQKAIHELHETHMRSNPMHFYQENSYLKHLCRMWSDIYSQFGIHTVELQLKQLNQEYCTPEYILNS